jgi:hypothetical protein
MDSALLFYFYGYNFGTKLIVAAHFMIVPAAPFPSCSICLNLAASTLEQKSRWKKRAR